MTQPVEQHSELMQEIDEVVAELGYTAEYEAQLLEILRRGWLRGPQTIPLDADHWSLQLKRCHLELCLIYQDDDRQRRAPKAAALALKALHSVRELLVDGLAQADAQLVGDIAEPILSVVTAQQSALARRQPARRRGGQTDSSQVPQLALMLLLDYYFAATGDWPTRYQDGPFVEFAADMLEVPAATIFRQLKRFLNLLPARSGLSGVPNITRGPIGLKALAQRFSMGH